MQKSFGKSGFRGLLLLLPAVLITCIGTVLYSPAAARTTVSTSSESTFPKFTIPPTPTVTAGGSTALCQGSSVTLTASATGATSYQWYLNGAAISGATAQTYAASTAGDYTATATNTDGTSGASAATTVTVSPIPPTPTITAGGNTSFCTGGSVLLTANASGAAAYQWFLGGTAISGATSATYTANASGDFTVVVSNSSGCSSAASATTTVTLLASPSAPTINPGGPTTFCAGGSVTLNASASGAATYQWYLNGTAIGGATANAYTANASGNYTLVIANAGGCTSPASVATSVVVNPIPAAPTITAGGSTTFCSGGNVLLTANATGANSYQWWLNGSAIGGATSQTFTATAAGSYTVSITNSNACASPASAATTVSINPTPATPTITANGNTPLCQGQTVTLTANGSGAASYQWYLGGAAISGANGLTYSAGASGSYTVSSTDGNGCISAASNATTVTINPPPPAPTITAGGPTTFCIGGSVTLTASAGGAVVYQWYLNSAAIPGATSNNYTASTGGDYSVTITNANGCTSAPSTTTTVIVNAPPPNPPTITPGGPTDFCSPGSVVLTTTSASAYQWLLNGSPISGATNQSYTASLTGNYSVTINSGCTASTSAATAVTAYTSLASATISAGGPTTICQGTSVVLTTSATNVQTFQWFLNGAAIGGATGQSYSATTAGSYTVTVTNPCNSATSTATVITVNPQPNMPSIIAAGPTTFCAPGSVLLTESPGGETSYQWFLNGVSITGSTSISYTATATGAYTVTAVNALGCSSPPSPETDVTVYPPLSTPTITVSGPTTFCAGNNVILSTSEVGVLNYQWYLNGTAISGATASSYTATASGSYTVGITNPCSNATSTGITVTVNPLPPTPTISAGGPTTFCSPGSVSLTASSTGATAYQWYLDGTPITGATAQIYVANGSGVYNVMVFNASGCSDSAGTGTTVSVFPPLAPLSISVSTSGTTTFCQGGSVLLTANASGAATYQWFLNGVAITGANATTYTAIESGTYTMMVTNPCSTATSNPTTVTVNPAPATPIVTAGGSVKICAGDSVILTANASGAVSYQWYLGGTAESMVTTSTDTAKASGDYTVTVTNASGCTSAPSTTITVTVNPLPAAPGVSVGGPTTFCQGSSVALTASPGTAPSYQWYLSGTSITGATGASYAGTATGIYTVSQTDVNGCTSPLSASVPVTVNPDPPAPTVSAATTTTFCAGDSVILTATATGAVSYQWSLNGSNIGGANTTTDTAKLSGSYNVTITDVNGCTSTSTTNATVSVNPTPTTPLLTAGSSTSFCNGGSVLLTASASGATSYQWYQAGVLIPTATTGTYTATMSGSYTVAVTDANGCVSDASTLATVVSNPIPVAPTITASGPLNVCPGQTLVLTANPGSAASYTWYLNGDSIPGANSQNYTATTDGIYTVTETNSSGCVSPASAPATVNNPCLPRADLSIVKTVSPGPYTVQKPVTYTLTVTNNGPDSAVNVVISDTLSASLGDPTNYVGSPDPVYNTMSRSLTWSIPQIDPGTTLTFTFEAPITGFGTIGNTGYVTSTISDPDTTNNHSTAIFTMAGDLFIPNLVTPNGDGKNDLFYVIGLNKYPGSSLRVYNRWGSQVYQSQNYANDWGGAGLSDGTYYYVLLVNTPSGKQAYKGWVEIIH